MLGLARDRVLAALSWVPSESLRLPVVLLLVAGSAVCALLALPKGGPFSFGRASVGGTVGPAAGPRAVAARGAAVGTASLREDPFRPVFDEMVARLEGAARRHPARVAIYVKDLRRGWEWAYHADDLFPSASLIKVPIMAGVFERIHRGRLSLRSQLKLRRRTRMGGSGSIKWKRDGTRFSVRQLLDKMMHESDNTAMLLLIDEVGMGFLQNFFPKMGFVYTEIYPDGLRLTSHRVRYENYTTAREMGMLFERLYRGEVVDRFASELMLEIMKRRRARSRLAEGLPVGWEIAHKTGLLRRACHDAGIVFSPDGDYVIAVLTGRNRSYVAAKGFIGQLGKITYKHYKSGAGLYAKKT
ncbi:MAG: serine hydrolase [Elusimicrobiota bacterium]